MSSNDSPKTINQALTTRSRDLSCSEDSPYVVVASPPVTHSEDSSPFKILSTPSRRVDLSLGRNRKSAIMVVHILSLIFLVAVGVVCRPGSSFFSWHPFLMCLAFMFCMAQAILVFSPVSSLLAGQTRPIKVRVHWILQGAALIFALIGFSIIYINKERLGKPHATSWHGLLGYICVGQICAQCIGGVFLLYPNFLKNYFKLFQLKQLHATVGLLGFFLACFVVISGLNSTYFTALVENEYVWFAFAAVPFTLAVAIGNQVTTAYGPKKPTGKTGSTKR